MKISKLILAILMLNNFGNSLICSDVQGLVFSDESMPQVLAILEKLTGKCVLCDQSIANTKLSLQICRDMSKQDAIRALENVLGMNGITIINRGDGFLRAVSSRMATTCATEWLEESTLSIPVSEKIYTKLFAIEHMPVSNFATIVRPILSQTGSSIIIFENSNCTVITDKLSNLQRVELLIRNVDKPRYSRVESKIFRIKHADAENISSIIRKLLSNSITHLDGNGLHATENDQGNTAPGTVMQSDGCSSTEGFGFSSNVAIEHDKYSNSIIACGTQLDIDHVEKIINGLDILLEQVRIEVVIAQVTLAHNETSGLESLGISYNATMDAAWKTTYAGDNRVNLSGKGASNNKIGSGFNLSGTLNNFSLGYVFNKAKTCDNIKVLSAPTIVTTHNREASIKVGESHPIITANVTDLQNPQSIRNSVNYKDIGIELTVTPLIGPNGVIQMKIDQLIQKINGDVSIDGNKQPIIAKRQAVSFLSVADGEVVVLAGLQEKETFDSKGKLWLIGYLPIVGDILFSPKTKSERTNELIIFIRPSIIANPSSENEYARKVSENSETNSELNSYNSSGKFLIEDDSSKKQKQKIKPKIKKTRAM
jgi:general secretion pathway protein D